MSFEITKAGLKANTINSERQKMKKVITLGSLAAAVLFSAIPAQAQLRFETINFSNLMAPVTRAYVAPGKTKEYNIYGPWIELATLITVNGIPQTIVERQPFATAKEGRIKVKLVGMPNAARAILSGIVRIACPPLVACAPVHGFQVQVLSVGTLTSIAPNQNVAVNSYLPFTITGTGLDNSTVFVFRTDLRAVSAGTNNATTLSFNGSTAACGSNLVRVRDVAEGGDFYAFPGALNIDLATDCGYRPVGSSTISGGSTPGVPELQPVVSTTAFRHIAPTRKVANSFCQGMFAQAVTAIVKTITVGNVGWGVKNAGASTTTTFRAQLWRAGVMVDEKTISGLAAGASTSFSFGRSAQTEVARLGLVPPQLSQQIYNATGGECVQTVGQATQFDWQDPTWQIRVDPAQAVTTETNRSNNNKTF